MHGVSAVNRGNLSCWNTAWGVRLVWLKNSGHARVLTLLLLEYGFGAVLPTYWAERLVLQTSVLP